MENCQGSGDFSDECPTAVLGESLRLFHAGLAVLAYERLLALADRYQLPCPAELGVLESPCKLQCGQQCGINICQTRLLLLTSLDQARIGGCSPSSPSRGVGSPNHKKKEKKDILYYNTIVSEMRTTQPFSPKIL